MQSFWPFIILIAVLVLAAALLPQLKGQRSRSNVTYPYDPREALFSKAERSFFGVLQQAVDGRYLVFGKVNLHDILKVRSGLDKSEWQSAYNRISKKHMDYILCEPESLRIVAAIELDDKSHEREDRRERDAFVDAAFSAARLPLFHFPARQAYAINEVREALASILPPTAFPVPAQSLEAAATLQENPEAVAAQACPKCGAELVLRTAKKGPNMGKQFLACSQYPRCQTVVPL